MNDLWGLFLVQNLGFFWWWRLFHQNCTWITVEINLQGQSVSASNKLTISNVLGSQIGAFNSLWSFKEKTAQTLLLQKYIVPKKGRVKRAGHNTKVCSELLGMCQSEGCQSAGSNLVSIAQFPRFVYSWRNETCVNGFRLMQLQIRGINQYF